MYAEEDFLALSGIQHFAFCRRQWALIHIEQQWQENLHTMEGTILHERAHEASQEKRGDLIITRSMPVFSVRLGVRGVCDVVEFHRDDDGIPLSGRSGVWQPVPVEYKRGAPKEHDADALQLCAQALCLEDMLACAIPSGYLFYGETRRRQEIAFDAALRNRAETLLEEMHADARRGYTPKVKPGKMCRACSLEALCMPSLMRVASALAYMQTALGKEDGS